MRCCEYHHHPVGDGLADERHYDMDSLVTIDILLDEPGVDFDGGDFQTLELKAGQGVSDSKEGRQASGPSKGEVLMRHDFRSGDALVFVSHKYHCVAPVTSRGLRRVLVTELWGYGARSCPHRCECPGRRCPREVAGCDNGVVTSRGVEREKLALPFRLSSASDWLDPGSGRPCTRLLWQSNDVKQEIGPGTDVVPLSRDDAAWNVFGDEDSSSSDGCW